MGNERRQEALEAARRVSFCVLGQAQDSNTVSEISYLLLAWDARAERRGMVAGLREAQAELPGQSPMIKRELLYAVLEKRINALEAEGKEDHA